MSKGGVKMTKGKYTKGFTFTKGFTLVELLVVIAIIAILAGALFLIINPAQLLAKSRDSRRMSDLTELNKALSMGVADQKITITTIGPLISTTENKYKVDGVNGWVQFTPTGTGLSTYLGVLPRDPGTTAYYYQGDDTTSSWEINAVLEATDNLKKMTTDGGTNDDRWEIGTYQNLDFM